MYKIGVAQWCLDCRGVDTIFRAAQLGFFAIHISSGAPGEEFFVADSKIQQLYSQAQRDTSVDIAAIAFNILDTYALTSPPKTFQAKKCWDVIRAGIDAAANMKVDLVYLPSFQNSEIRNEYDLKRTAEVLCDTCIYAEKGNVVIATENTLNAENNKKIIKFVDHPKLHILIDTYNPILWSIRPTDLIRELWPYMCNQIHVKDGQDGIMGNAILNRGRSKFAETAI